MSVVAQQVATPPAQRASPARAQTPTPVPVTPAATPDSSSQLVPASAFSEPATSQTLPPQAAGVTATYVIGPDDSIAVTVWREPTLSGTFPVRPDGMISLALVGDILAAGRTPTQLSNDISQKLKKFLTDPTVAVTVLGINSKRVFLVGEVQHTGPIPLTSSMGPLEAIISAGGLTQYANKTHIYILRNDQGKQKKIPFDYKKAIKDGNLQGVTLLPGDTIVVP
jgi:polysaccharide export outer membrane protein